MPRTCAHVQAVFLLAHELSLWFGSAAFPAGQVGIWRYETPVLSGLYWLPWPAVTKYYNLRGFKQEQFILPQFWRLGVPNQVGSRAMLPLRPWVDSFFASF